MSLTLLLVMVKKKQLQRNSKTEVKNTYLKKSKKINSKKNLKKNKPKNLMISSNNTKQNTKQKKNEEKNVDIISQSFFDSQSLIKVQCGFCNENLNNKIKIMLEPFPKNIIANYRKGILPFELICLPCFVIKIRNNFSKIKSLNYFNEQVPHVYTNFRVINKMEQPIFTEDWSFGDEIKLLGAIARLGIGNWEEISKITGKGRFECESHYYTFYYKKKDDYIPKITLNNNISLKSDSFKKEMKKNKQEENKLLSKLGNDLGYIPFSSDNNQSNRAININRNNNKSEHSNTILPQNACNTLGYWPKRNEFDVEYKNDAELELMEIEYKENNPQNINDMYNKILINYNNILGKREERKKFVNDKNLYDIKKQITTEKKLNREDREIYQSIKQSLKYLTNEQFNEYFEGIILEKNLKLRINQLLYYYKLGYKTYDQIFKYINELKQKNSKIKFKYNQKNDLGQLNISLRDSTVKQICKLTNNGDEDKNQNLDKIKKLRNNKIL